MIAGAFSIYPTETIIRIGGLYSSMAEDMEIVVRIHRSMKKRGTPYKIFYLPDPIAWTKGPEHLKSLGKQRTRWHFGTLETIWYHKSMCLNPRFGLLGMFNYPFWILGEAFEPVMEALGYLYIALTWWLGLMNVPFFLLLTLLSFGFTFVYSVSCFLIEELSFKKYPSLSSLWKMILYSFFENFGYRQLTIYWRLKSFGRFLKTYKKISEDTRKVNKMVDEYQ